VKFSDLYGLLLGGMHHNHHYAVIIKLLYS